MPTMWPPNRRHVRWQICRQHSVRFAGCTHLMNRVPSWMVIGLLAATSPGSAKALEVGGVAYIAAARTSAVPAKDCVPDSKTIEKDLQHLPWKQFRSVVESVPKLKSGIDAYGVTGWQFVRANYTTYPWRKNIEKLDAPQKIHLAELIQNAKGSARRDYCELSFDHPSKRSSSFV